VRLYTTHYELTPAPNGQWTEHAVERVNVNGRPPKFESYPLPLNICVFCKDTGIYQEEACACGLWEAEPRNRAAENV